ncbi:MAG TPA: PAS domain-containing sensor histidine kinase [Candidatus Eisenbacteria bacterium]|nr:PAS domain-containing sensor histidine kinase [Candidatus Eisenbacteria bacterium]
MLRAIRAGEVDALIVRTADGDRPFVLEGADRPYRVFVDGMQQGAATLTPDGLILYCNRSFADMLGRSARHVVGQPVFGFVPPEFHATVRRLLEHDAPRVGDRTLELASLAGGRVPVHVAASPLEDRLFAWVVTDLTERLEHAASLAMRNDELERINERLSQFTYSVAHDLRAPIRAIRGYLDALVEEIQGSSTSEQRIYAARIADATQRLDTLINDLLSYSRMGQVEFAHSPLRLREVVHDAMLQIESDISASSARVALDIPDGTPRVVAHGPTLVQVVVNLLSNALKFVPHDTTPEVRLRSEPAGARVRLWVEDNGVGVAPQHHKRIFEMFETLDRRYPGTGLGLALVRRAVDRMGGEVGIESTGEGGSAFWIELPAEPCAARDPAIAATAPSAQDAE